MPLTSACCNRCNLGIRVYERINHERIVHRSSTLAKYTKCVVRAETWAIRSIRCQCVKAVDYRQYSSTEGDLGTGYARRITVAIPLFVVMSDNWNHWKWKRDG
jgi:hypothetical protein